MTAESPPTTAQHAELNVAQWRNVFGHLDALLDVPSGERMQVMSARAATVDEGVVVFVLKDFANERHWRTCLNQQALLGSTHLPCSLPPAKQ